MRVVLTSENLWLIFGQHWKDAKVFASVFFYLLTYIGPKGNCPTTIGLKRFWSPQQSSYKEALITNCQHFLGSNDFHHTFPILNPLTEGTPWSLFEPFHSTTHDGECGVTPTRGDCHVGYPWHVSVDRQRRSPRHGKSASKPSLCAERFTGTFKTSNELYAVSLKAHFGQLLTVWWSIVILSLKHTNSKRIFNSYTIRNDMILDNCAYRIVSH